MKIMTLSCVALLLLLGTAIADPAAVGIYFDAAATQSSLTRTAHDTGTITAYIFATHTEQTVGGAAFRLVMDPKVTLVGASYPAGIQVGTLADGIQIGLTNCEMGFYGRPVRLATLTLSTARNWMFDADLHVESYPPAGVVQLADCQGTITEVVGGHAALTVDPPTRIGVYFDTDATMTNRAWLGPNWVVTAYVIAVDSEQMVGGCAYRLDLDYPLLLLSQTYPPGVQIGDPLSGVQVTFSVCHDGSGGANVLVSTFSFWTGDSPLSIARICVEPHPGVNAVQIVDCRGAVRAVEGGCATLMDSVPVKSQTWGAVKALYGH